MQITILLIIFPFLKAERGKILQGIFRNLIQKPQPVPIQSSFAKCIVKQFGQLSAAAGTNIFRECLATEELPPCPSRCGYTADLIFAIATESFSVRPMYFDKEYETVEEFKIVECGLGLLRDAKCTSDDQKEAFQKSKNGHVVLQIDISFPTDHTFVIQMSNSEYFVWQSYIKRYTLSDYIQHNEMGGKPLTREEMTAFMKNLKYVIFPSNYNVTEDQYQKHHSQIFSVESNHIFNSDRGFVLNSRFHVEIKEFKENACAKFFMNSSLLRSPSRSRTLKKHVLRDRILMKKL